MNTRAISSSLNSVIAEAKSVSESPSKASESTSKCIASCIGKQDEAMGELKVGEDEDCFAEVGAAILTMF